MTCLNGSTKGLAKEREVGNQGQRKERLEIKERRDVVDGRKPVRKKREEDII